ncbi:hypothetical protein ACJA25_02250 [Mycoplasmopsis hyopharyngis]|uniref:hypothetical protein n=1 Tax=Mycoplasmopsis hyopharyngis TaxID=29558 RepID=UPI00387310FC
MSVALDNAKKNILSNIAIQVRNPQDKTDVALIDKEFKSLNEAFFKAKSICEKRIDLIEIKFELSNRLNEFCAKYEISPAINNVFKKFYENEKLNEKMDELTSKENDPTVDNKTFEDKINEFIKSFNSLKKNVVDTKKLIDQKISDFNVLLKEIRDWKSISPNAADELYLNPNIDANDFMNVLFGSSAGIGEEQKIENYLNETVKKYLVDSNEIGIKLNEFKKTIQDLKTQKRDKHRQTILLKAEIEKFEQLIEANAPKTSQPTGNYDEDKKFIYKPLNLNANDDVNKFKKILTRQYSLNQIKKDNSNQNTLDVQLENSFKEYKNNIEKANSDLQKFVNDSNGKINFVNPNTNAAFNSNDKSEVLPSTIKNFIQPSSLVLVTPYLQGNLYVDVEMKPDDANGKMFYTKKYWYAETEYINPNNPNEGKKIVNKFYFYSDAQKIEDGFKQFAFTDDDNVIFQVHGDIKDSYENIESIVHSLSSNSDNNTLVKNDYLCGSGSTNDKILSISFVNNKNKEMNTYLFRRCYAKTNSQYVLVVEYSISRLIKNGNSSDTQSVAIKQEEINFENIILRNKEQNQASKQKKDVTFFYEQLKNFSDHKLDSKKDSDLKTPTDALLAIVKQEVVDKDISSLSTGQSAFDDFINKCKELKKQLIEKYSEVTNKKSQKKEKYSNFTELKSKVEFLIFEIERSPYSKADSDEKTELEKIKTNIETILDPNTQTTLENMSTTYEQSNESFKKYENDIKEKNVARTLLLFTISEIKEQIQHTFVNDKLKNYFEAKANDYIKEAETIAKETGKTKQLIEQGNSELTRKFEELTTKNDQINDKYNKLNSLYNQALLYKNNNLLEKPYLENFKTKLEGYITSAKNVLDKVVEKDKEEDLNKINIELESLTTNFDNVKKEIAQVVLKYDELNKFINNFVVRYTRGLILTKVATGSEPAIEALQIQDYEDIAKPLIDKMNEVVTKMNQKDDNILQKLGSLLEEMKTAYEAAKTKKIDKDIQKKKLNKLISEKEKFVSDNLVGVWIANVSTISNIFTKEINEAKTKYDASSSTIETFKTSIEKLNKNTDVTQNVVPDNLMAEWDKAQKEAIDKINEFLTKIEKFKTEDKEEDNNVTIFNDSELKNETEFVKDIDILKKVVNGNKIGNNDTFISVGEKYNHLENTYQQIIKHKILKIQERNEFLHNLKTAAFYFNHAKSDNAQQEWSKPEYTVNRDLVPGFVASEDFYKTLNNVNTENDNFSTVHKDKIEQYRKQLDAKFAVSSVNSNLKTYKKATEELKKYISDYIAANLKALQEAQTEYDKVVESANTLKNNANVSTVFKKVFDAITEALNVAQTEYNAGTSELKPNKIKDATNKLRNAYSNQNNLFNDINTAYVELKKSYANYSEDLKLYSESSKFNNYKEQLNKELDIVNTMLTKGKLVGGNNYTGVDSGSELSLLQSKFETNAKNIFAQHQNQVAEFFNKNYKEKLDQFNGAKEGLLEPRDNTTGFKNLQNIFESTNSNQTAYLGRSPIVSFSSLESVVSNIDTIFSSTLNEMNNRKALVVKYNEAMANAEKTLGRPYNSAYSCCQKTCHPKIKWGNFDSNANSEGYFNTLKSAIDNAKTATSAEIFDKDLENHTNIIIKATQEWIDHSGGSRYCSSTVHKCTCAYYYTQM